MFLASLSLNKLSFSFFCQNQRTETSEGKTLRKHDSEGFYAFACSETISTIFCVYRVGARTLASDSIVLLLKNPQSFNKSIKQMYRYTKTCLCISVYIYMHLLIPKKYMGKFPNTELAVLVLEEQGGSCVHKKG